ncbi:secondary thiamine-phosphate synthase enzyme YjbQ [Methylobacterium platani]|uniref:Secondary thiamine-phosphate synthase enzyme n=2 Tax=Methylobacterium platani TaxID=427683 RepID=A0A179SCP0_9HYPH|nr:secondary thiamine-phosphate synthase enzyme YjbQ [Methylobacterium platani]KMO18823.1 secondary thiamine-phosphate synthase enzyme [Methylobacterium platani JCM 14648]OAS25618.1 secondary thiamine-phosphate synthase enzyme [Methylobacterium platani]
MRRIAMLDNGPVTRQATGRLVVETRGPGFTEITDEAAAFVREAGLRHGLLTVFCRHTSASLTIQENADPDVRTDLMTALDRLAPRDVPYVHGIEGPDDMPAHIRTLLTDATLTIPLVEGRLALGTWQGIYLIEHRDRPHRREIVLHLVGR